MKKQIFCVLTILMLVFAGFSCISASAITCSLTENEAAESLYELGLLQGTGQKADGSIDFQSTRKLTREQAVTMIVRLLGAESDALNGNNQNPFTDVSEWAVPYVSYAYANGITQGVSATKFDGGSNLNDYAFLTMVLRTLGYSDSDGDFAWDSPYALAREAGLVEWDTPNTRFKRGDAFIICHNALTATAKSQSSIAQSLIAKGVFTAEKFEAAAINRADLAKGADLRIMSYNILTELPSHPDREENVLKVLRTYKPDVVGLQEVDGPWHYVFKAKMADEYVIASSTTPNGLINYTTIAYNINTTELLECNTTLYVNRDTTRESWASFRNFTWARFRRISDGAEYIVTSTHWDIDGNLRMEQWEENVKLINELYEKYKLPIFATGDYNSNVKSYFGEFLKAASLRDSEKESQVKNNTGKTTHALYKQPTGTDLSIDHIAVTSEPELIYYNRLTCPTVINASDHCPVYIDVRLK